MQSLIGPAANRVGSYIAGGYALTLHHRHDIRVGAASAMFLTASGVSAILRLEILTFLYPLYWRWPTKVVLQQLFEHLPKLTAAAAAGAHDHRASIYQEAFDHMRRFMDPYQVIGYRDDREVKLVLRSEAKTSYATGCFGYHPYSNPESRRTGRHECEILLQDVKSGSLWRACEELFILWTDSDLPISYTQCAPLLRQIQLWAGARAIYNRTRFLRWLFKAEGKKVEVSEQDWKLLAVMGSGIQKGLAEAGITTFEEAKAACGSIAAVLGAEQSLDDFSCFMCLSQHKEAMDNTNIPKAAAPVSIRDDLGLEAINSRLLSKPLARITSKTNLSPAIAHIVAQVMLTILPHTNAASGATLSQCCRAFRGRVASAFADTKGMRQPKIKSLNLPSLPFITLRPMEIRRFSILLHKEPCRRYRALK